MTTTRMLKTAAAAAVFAASMAAGAQTPTAGDLIAAAAMCQSTELVNGTSYLIAAGAKCQSKALANGTSFSALGGSLDAKTINGVTGVDISGGGSRGEIGQSITASFANRTRLSSSSLAFLFDAPEYGDVNEVATVSLPGTDYFGRLTAADTTTAIRSLYSGTVTNQNDASLSRAGVWTVTTPSGNVVGRGVRFETSRGSPGLDCNGCANQSDHSVLSVSPVPEPSSYALALIGLLTVGFAARRRNKNNAG